MAWTQLKLEENSTVYNNAKAVINISYQLHPDDDNPNLIYWLGLQVSYRGCGYFTKTDSTRVSQNYHAKVSVSSPLNGVYYEYYSQTDSEIIRYDQQPSPFMIYAKANRTTVDQIATITLDFEGYKEGLYGQEIAEKYTKTATVTVPALPSYPVSYNANGHGTAPANQAKYYNVDLTLASAIAADGYSFKRWNTNNTDTGTAYNANSTYTSNAALSLYAIWNRTITYNANGGSNAPNSQTALATNSIPISTIIPTYTNYIFKEWNTASDSTGLGYTPGETYAVNQPSSTFYAIWNHKIEYNANGGTSAPEASVALKDNPITVTSNAPTYTGYTFKEWNTTSDGTGTSYISNSSYPANSPNTILYAIWNRTITYNINGGDDDSLIPTPQTDEITNPITITPSIPSKTDYAFVEWNTEIDGTGISYPSGAIYAANLPNITLYAQWEPDPGGGGEKIEPEKIIDFTMVDDEGNPINKGGTNIPSCAIELILVPCNPTLEYIGKINKQDFTYTSNFLYQKGDSYTLVNSSNLDFENNTYYEKIPYDFDYYDWQIMSASTV